MAGFGSKFRLILSPTSLFSSLMFGSIHYKFMKNNHAWKKIILSWEEFRMALPVQAHFYCCSVMESVGFAI